MRTVVAAATSAAAAGAVLALGWRRRTILGLDWHRTNHAGRTVTLWEGAALAAGAAVGSAVAGSPAGSVATVGAAAFGGLDDHRGDSESKGLRGHLGALREGRVTTGAVKIVGIGATGLAAAALADRPHGGAVPRVPAAHTLVGGAVIAASANLANLLDLRPGRALKVTILGAAPLAIGRSSVPAAAAVGAAAAVIRPDLHGRSMLGDTGANAAGALVGLALVEGTGLRGRVVALLTLTAFTVASEKVSFTAVIESTPVLRELDRWGRRP